MSSFCNKSTSHDSCHDLRNCKCKEFNAASYCGSALNCLEIEWKVV